MTLNLTNTQDYFNFQTSILKGAKTTAEILEFFEFLEKNPLSLEHFLAIYKASKAFTLNFKVDFPTIDIVGTGGDLIDTFNISTISALVSSACGITVAKHGNRSASSKVGSADLLEELGIEINLNQEQAKVSLAKNHFAFLFAPNFNPSFRFAKEARREFKKQTYFNFLGPLLNPVNPEFSLVGCAKAEMVEFMGKALIENGSKKVWVVRSEIGINEINPCGKTRVVEFTRNSQKRFEIEPGDFGLKVHKVEEILSRDLYGNLEITKNILENKATLAQKDAILINVSAALYIFGKAKDLKEGVEITMEALENGKALDKLNQFL